MTDRRDTSYRRDQGGRFSRTNTNDGPAERERNAGRTRKQTTRKSTTNAAKSPAARPQPMNAKKPEGVKAVYGGPSARKGSS